MNGLDHKKSKDEKNKDEFVLTPGGYKPKSSVKEVGPNEAVRRMANGNYSVVKRDRPTKDESKSKNETGSEA
jgi:hypothetical protein